MPVSYLNLGDHYNSLHYRAAVILHSTDALLYTRRRRPDVVSRNTRAYHEVCSLAIINTGLLQITAFSMTRNGVYDILYGPQYGLTEYWGMLNALMKHS